MGDQFYPILSAAAIAILWVFRETVLPMFLRRRNENGAAPVSKYDILLAKMTEIQLAISSLVNDNKATKEKTCRIRE